MLGAEKRFDNLNPFIQLGQWRDWRFPIPSLQDSAGRMSLDLVCNTLKIKRCISHKPKE